MGVAEDEALARYLQQQEDGAGAYYDDSPDDKDDGSDYEWGGGKKKAKRRAPAKAQARRKAPAKKESTQNQGSATVGNSAGSGPAEGEGEKKKTPARWTDEEQRLFLEGLELYGRDWDKLAGHVGHGRDKNAVKSHAQKHFVKLHITAQPLPDKVKESGEGYTLSGKALDPESAALKAYSNASAYRKGIAERKKQQNGAQTNGTPSESSADTKNEAPTEKQAPAQKPPKTEKENARPKRTRDSAVREEVGEEGGREGERTEYATKRLRHKERSVGYLAQDEIARDPHTMVSCERYAMKGSGSGPEQPYSVVVEGLAVAVMDFHAHLASAEIIGFLGGTWDAEKRVLHVQHAYPCRELLHDDPHANYEVNVEMHPESEIEVREKITSSCMQVVGWYHSHPTFKPIPSNRDVENQHNYQVLFQDPKEKIAPFVGAIVGPYDQAMPTDTSVVNWFHVRRPPTATCEGEARALDVETTCSPLGPRPNALDLAVKEMQELVDTYCTSAHRIASLDEVWRYSSGAEGEGAIARSIGAKLALSLGARLANAGQRRRVEKEVLGYLRERWEEGPAA